MEPLKSDLVTQVLKSDGPKKQCECMKWGWGYLQRLRKAEISLPKNKILE